MSRPGQQLQRGAEGGRARHGARGRAKGVCDTRRGKRAAGRIELRWEKFMMAGDASTLV
jgi:hypothetical protein